jgi:hypothetical protein
MKAPDDDPLAGVENGTSPVAGEEESIVKMEDPRMLTAQVPSDLMEKLDALAHERWTNRSSVVRSAIVRELKAAEAERLAAA